MPRLKKPEVAIKGFQPLSNIPVRVDIMLDKNTFKFFFEYQGESFEENDLVAIKIKANQVIKDSTELDFVPIITIEVSARHSASISLSFHREFIARRIDGKWLSVSYETYESRKADKMWIFGAARYDHTLNYRMKNAEHFPGKIVTKDHNRSEYMVSYDEKLWLGLIELQNAIRAMREKLADLFEEEGMVTIAAASINNLLSSGDDSNG